MLNHTTLPFLVALMIFALTGCDVGTRDTPPQQPLPPPQALTPAQQDVTQQLANERARVAALEAALGAQAKTIQDQNTRVAEAHALVDQAKAAGDAAIAAADAKVKNAVDAATRQAAIANEAAVKAAVKQEREAAGQVLADETGKLKQDIKAAHDRAVMTWEWYLGVLGLLGVFVAVFVSGERMNAIMFSATCAFCAFLLITFESMLSWIPYIVGTMVAGGGAYMLFRHVSLGSLYDELRSLVGSVAKLHPEAGWNALEGKALTTWHTIVADARKEEVTVKAWLAHIFTKAKQEAAVVEAKAQPLLAEVESKVGLAKPAPAAAAPAAPAGEQAPPGAPPPAGKPS